MHFLVFLPGVQSSDPAGLVNAGLADLVAGANFLSVAEGPDGRPGMIVGWPRPGKLQQHFAPLEQTWLPAVRTAELSPFRYWVGVWNDAPPRPSHLVRPYLERGTECELGDGQKWLIPLFRELPRDLILQDDGTWKYEVQRKFHALFHEGCGWFKRFATWDGQTGISYPELAAYVVRSLQINYRITPEIVSHLRLLSTSNVLQTALAITGGQP